VVHLNISWGGVPISLAQPSASRTGTGSTEGIQEDFIYSFVHNVVISLLQPLVSFCSVPNRVAVPSEHQIKNISGL
jgi:hypothetical protein